MTALPDRSTAEAQAMGIDRLMGSYKTYNAGTWDRITNLRLGVTLLDGTLVAPGGTFSLNDTIGERTEERGFRSAPVIIGTEYEEEVGGGTSQVATTVFNTAWEAGVRITERNPHSLYISRYQLGRDATVYWPSLDLKFQNDTAKWILVKGYVEGDGIRVSLYGGERRRVESSSGTFEVTGKAPVERVPDPTLLRGQTAVESEGSSPSRTSVTQDDLRRKRRPHAGGDVEHVVQGRDQGRPLRDEAEGEAEASSEDSAHGREAGRRRRAADRRDGYAAGASALATASASQSGTRTGR